MRHPNEKTSLKLIKAAAGQKGKDVSGSVELRFKGRRIGFEVYNSRKERSRIVSDWRESTNTPYHDNEYYLTIKND